MRSPGEPIPSAAREPARPEAARPAGHAGALGAPTPAKPSLALQAGFAAAVLLVAGVGYSLTGSNVRTAEPSMPMAAAEGEQPGQGSAPVPAGITADVSAVVTRLAERLKGAPDDAAGWTLLARAYSAMGRFEEAVAAYDRVLKLAGESADVLADSADALVAQNNGRLSGEAARRVERALALEPANRKALALAGSAAFDLGDYAAAVRYWERVAQTLPANSAMREPLQASIAQARHLGRLPAGDQVAAVVAAPAAAPGAVSSAAPSAASVNGTVSLAAELAAKAGPDAIVFVAARAVEGPRLPLAVMRVKVKDLPLQFTLDDSMAMAPGAVISGHAQVVVTARVSQSGHAAPQPGDFVGQSGVVAPGARGVAVQINSVVGQ